MAKYPSDVIRVAYSQLGYLEKSTNKLLDEFLGMYGNKNYTKYARDINTVAWFNGNKQGAEWCTTFLNWCFWRAFGLEGKDILYQPKDNKVNYGAGCIYAARYYRNNKAWYTSPAIGDQIFFGKAGDEDHTGLVVAYDNSYVYTIEGNSANSVRLCCYSRTDDWIVGYGRPKYDKNDPYGVHLVKKGDVLTLIAATYNSSVPVIVKENGLKSSYEIHVNDILFVKKNIKDEPAIFEIKGGLMVLQAALGIPLSNVWDSTTEAHASDRALKKGKSNYLVKVLQTFLSLNDYNVAIDGEFGNQTYNAVVLFQQQHFLGVDGIVGPETWRKLVG